MALALGRKLPLQIVVAARLMVVPRAGVEPARPFGQRILSPVIAGLPNLTI